MKIYDYWSSLFWLMLSIAVCAESLRLGIGTLGNPGMGFMAFGTSALLGILSLVLLISAIFRNQKTKSTNLLFGRVLWKRIILVLISLVIYAKLMPLLGYLISTFLLMNFLFWIVRGQKWWWVLVSSFLTTLISYYLFSKWLSGQFPDGIFGF
jgi:putative tricarboxylic transport membrane protein